MPFSEEINVFETGIDGFDNLFEQKGIPEGSTVLVAGGPGTGKSIFCRQLCYNAIKNGKSCMYVSFEEERERIIESMKHFGWNIDEFVDSGKFIIQKINPLDILRMKFGSIEGSGSATELSYKIKPLVIPKGFDPDVIAIDTLSAVLSASITKDKNKRVYLEQFFRFFTDTGATSFLITETESMPTKYSESGIEDFLADGILVFYNIAKEDRRENALEVLKMRDCKHEKKIVSIDITDEGIKVFPDKSVSIT
ncbi:MAG: ATPase domain-containing protein [Candidatus Thermoplasmatota archaeon]